MWRATATGAEDERTLGRGLHKAIIGWVDQRPVSYSPGGVHPTPIYEFIGSVIISQFSGRSEEGLSRRDDVLALFNSYRAGVLRVEFWRINYGRFRFDGSEGFGLAFCSRGFDSIGARITSPKRAS
jgi:hypothetical protein